ncbi:MAG: hypothetical protein GEEBNDBF_02534 [bacterium]|nr:hypothetical protein [bacterium]
MNSLPRTFALGCVLLSLLAGCQQQSPAIPDPADSADPEAMPPLVSADPLPDVSDEGYRGLTALLTGDLSLDGTVVTDPGYTGTPTSVSQPATAGELVLLRIRARMSDSSTPTLHTNMRGTGGTAYSAMNIPANDVSQYKALYVTASEGLSLRVYNSESYNTPINAQAAFFNYSYETRAVEDSSEPNDDENAATVTDRTLAKNLGVGLSATRSFFQYDSTTKDLEDWFSTTLQAGRIYRYKFTSFNPRYGTWGYTLKLFNSAGTQVGSTITLPTGWAGGNLTTPSIPTTGTYYIQLVGTPVTKSFGSNLFYSQYTITPCETVQIGTVAFTPNEGNDRCPGTSGTFVAQTSGAAPVSAEWSFGPGAKPSTSTALQPSVTLNDVKGLQYGTVKLTSACGAQTTKTFIYFVECSWGQTFGQLAPAATSTVTPNAIAVSPAGDVWITGSFVGSSVNVTVQNPTLALNSQGSQNGFLIRLNPAGDIGTAVNIAEGSGICLPMDIVLDAQGHPWVAGFYYGTLDFAPGSATANRTSNGQSDAFLVRNISGVDNYLALTWGGAGFDSAEAVVLDANGYPTLTGYFQQTVDMDPGAGVLNKTSAGGYDAFVLNLFNTTGDMNNLTVWGGTDSDRGYDLAFSNNALYVVGAFAGTTGFDPSAAVLSATSAGSDDAFCVKLNRFTYLPSWLYQYGAAGADRAFNVVTDNNGYPRIAGIFGSIVDFDPGPGFQARGAYGGSDAVVVALTDQRVWQWHAWVGSDGSETVHDLAFVSDFGAVAVVGHFNGQARFSSSYPGSGLTNLYADGQDGFISYIQNSEGAVLKPQQYGGSSTDAVRAIATQPISLGNVYLAGTFRGSVDLDPSTSFTENRTVVGSTDGWVTRHNYFGDWYRP